MQSGQRPQPGKPGRNHQVGTASRCLRQLRGGEYAEAGVGMNSRTPDKLLETHGSKATSSTSTFPVSILYLGLARAVGMTLLLNQPVKRS